MNAHDTHLNWLLLQVKLFGKSGLAVWPVRATKQKGLLKTKNKPKTICGENLKDFGEQT